MSPKFRNLDAVPDETTDQAIDFDPPDDAKQRAEIMARVADVFRYNAPDQDTIAHADFYRSH